MSTSWRFVAIVTAVLATGGCGVRLQDEPQSIKRREVPYGILDHRAHSATSDAASFVVYFLHGDRLVAVPRTSASPATPRTVIDEFLRGPTPEESAAELTTAVPGNTALVGVDRLGGVLIIHLGGSYSGDSESDLAGRQLRATMLELPGVDDVRLFVGGLDVTPS